MENGYNDNKKKDGNNNEKNLNNNLYEILGGDYPKCDVAFKIIIIGDSGKKLIK